MKMMTRQSKEVRKDKTQTDDGDEDGNDDDDNDNNDNNDDEDDRWQCSTIQTEFPPSFLQGIRC